MEVTAVVSGIEPLIRNLGKFKETTERSIVRRSMQFASTPVNKSAKRNVSVDTGALKRSIGKKVKTYRQSGTTAVIIGPRTGFNTEEGRNPTKYAHLVELGTDHSAAKPFLRPALHENGGVVVSRFRQRTWEGIRREAAKLAASQKV